MPSTLGIALLRLEVLVSFVVAFLDAFVVSEIRMVTISLSLLARRSSYSDALSAHKEPSPADDSFCFASTYLAGIGELLISRASFNPDQPKKSKELRAKSQKQKVKALTLCPTVFAPSMLLALGSLSFISSPSLYPQRQ